MLVADLVKAYYAALNADDMDRLCALLSEDVVHDVNQGQREIGKAKFRAHMTAWRDHCRERAEDLVIMASEKDGRAAVEFTAVGKYVKTLPDGPEAHGQSYRLPCGAFFAVQGGKISRVTQYANLVQWRKLIHH